MFSLKSILKKFFFFTLIAWIVYDPGIRKMFGVKSDAEKREAAQQAKEEQTRKETDAFIAKGAAIADEAIRPLRPDLQAAEAANVTDLETLLGFRLNWTENEVLARQAALVEQGLATVEKGTMYMQLKDFGDAASKVRVTTSPHFLDSNTASDTIAAISFIFDEYNSVLNPEKAKSSKLLRAAIAKRFDNSWKHAQIVSDTQGAASSAHDYWIRNNVAVEYHHGSLGSPALTYYNMPKETADGLVRNLAFAID